MELAKLGLLFDVKKIDELLGDSYFSFKEIAKVENLTLRAAAFKGEYHWHAHDHDELFYIYKGSIILDTEEGPISLSEGQGTMVPAKMKHKPFAQERAIVLVLY